MESRFDPNENFSAGDLHWAASIIKKTRLEKEWSQEALSHGICAVSTLSKIESGAALPSLEMLELFERKLGIRLSLPDWQQKQREKHWFDLLEEGRMLEFGDEFRLFKEQRIAKGELLDLNETLLDGLESEGKGPVDLSEEILPFMNGTQKAMFYLLTKNFERSVSYDVSPWIALYCSMRMYDDQYNESAVLEMADKAYQKAADEGQVRLMGLISHHQAVVYSNIDEQQKALKCINRSLRIFTAIKADEELQGVFYNFGCISMQAGDFEKALSFFEKDDPGFMTLIKRALCHEQLHQMEKARALLNLARTANESPTRHEWPAPIRDRIIRLLEMRLDLTDWLHDPEYGRTLEELFDQLQTSSIHKGFAQFYLPWMIQYYKANRQYAKLAALLENFPGKPLFRVT